MLVAAQAADDQLACAQLHTLLGRVLLDGGHLRQAEAELRSGLELFLRHLGVGHLNTARCAAAPAPSGRGPACHLARQLPRPPACLPACVPASLGPPWRPRRRCRCYEALGLGMVRLGRAGDALSYLQQCLDIREGVLPPGHPLVLSTMGHLGEVRRRQGRLEEAEALHRQALELRQGQEGAALPGRCRRRAAGAARRGQARLAVQPPGSGRLAPALGSRARPHATAQAAAVAPPL
jgi:hypothetical protein